MAILSGWLGDHNKRVGLLGLGHVASLGGIFVPTALASAAMVSPTLTGNNITVNAVPATTIGIALPPTLTGINATVPAVSCTAIASFLPPSLTGVLPIPVISTGTVTTNGAGLATLTSGTITSTAVGGQATIGGQLVVVTSVISPTQFTYIVVGGGSFTVVTNIAFSTIKSRNPIAIQTWTFDVWWQTSRDHLRGWSTPVKILNNTLTGPALLDMGDVCSAGAEKVTDTKMGLITTTNRIRHPNGTITVSGTHIAFLGDGMPFPAKPVICASITSQFGGPETMDYWDISQGAWWFNNAYYVLAYVPLNTHFRYSILRSDDNGNTWVEQDATNAPDGIISASVRRSLVSDHVDVVTFDNNSNTLVLNSFDLGSRTWTGSYGAVSSGRRISVSTNGGNGIVRFPNNDIGILYTDDPYATKVCYRLYSSLSATWGSEVVIAGLGGPGPLAKFANMVIDPSGELLHVFHYLDGIQPVYSTITHYGVGSGPLFTFPKATVGTDGIGHGIALDGLLYIPYDLWEDQANCVWICPLGTTNFVKNLLPVPPSEGGNPSCSYMVFGTPPTSGYVAQGGNLIGNGNYIT